MSEDAGRLLCVAALLAAGLLVAWAAWACHRAQKRDLPGADATVWAGLAAVFLLLSQAKLARGMGWLKELGEWLRARSPSSMTCTLTGDRSRSSRRLPLH